MSYAGPELLIYAEDERLFPTKGSELATGYDLRSAEDVVLKQGEFKAVSTGLMLDFSRSPMALDVQVRPRSGLAAKYGITVLNSPGTIDRDFEGIIKVILINLGPTSFIINKGDRIAQLVLGTLQTYGVDHLKSAPLRFSKRGEGGFGSTGIS